MKIKFISALLLITSSFSFATANWTGNLSLINYNSQYVITDLHIGQYNWHEYFCIKLTKSGSENVVACNIKRTGNWGQSYQAFRDQARYFYTTGAKIRVYVQPGVWTDPDFYNVFSKNEIAGLSSCDESTCFGPQK